jgi:rod shape-determining protein MreB
MIRGTHQRLDHRFEHALNLLNSVLGLWSADVGIDLGTANTLVHVRGRGIVLNEPSVVAVSKRTGQVLSVGTEARRMLGRTPADIIAMRPMRDGVIADFDRTEQMIRHFIARAHNRAFHISHPRVVLGVPSGVTEVEKRAVTDAATMAGAREAHLIEEPMAAAIGAGLPVQEAGGSMVVDIGGGTTEVAVISLGGVVAATSARVGGDEMDEAVVQYVRRNMGLLIGERTAEDIKIAMGSAFPLAQERSFIVRGRDLVTGLPKTVEMTTEHVRTAVSGVLVDIVRAIKGTLDATPPELVEDIIKRGLVLCGGGALLSGLDQLVAHETLVPVRVADDPLTCVVRGTGIVVEEIDTLNRVLLKTRRARALRY